MEKVVAIVFIVIILFYVVRSYRKTLVAKRERLISTFSFSPVLKDKIIQAYPHLDKDQADKVLKGLREYFQLCNIAGKRMVAMPSQVVDVAWHEFILFTREYERFCMKALGRFIHHTPAEAMETRVIAQKGIKRAWKISCFRENISVRNPERLPLLFAMDTDLNIEDGFKYTLNCKSEVGNGADSAAYCAGHIGCGSGCGGGGGCFGDSDGGSSSADSGGGDSGCGGGCGGGD